VNGGGEKVNAGLATNGTNCMHGIQLKANVIACGNEYIFATDYTDWHRLFCCAKKL